MTHDHEDPEFDRWLQDAAKSYHTPPAPPRDAMWARIAAERRRRGVVPLRPWMRWAIAAAALIAIGVGIGRWTARQPSAPATPLAAGTSAQTGDSAATALVYRMAATQYFSRAEAFLTSYRTDARAGAHSARFAGQARDLLTTTQLMLDSPAGNDAQLRSLLRGDRTTRVLPWAHLPRLAREYDAIVLPCNYLRRRVKQIGRRTPLCLSLTCAPAASLAISAATAAAHRRTSSAAMTPSGASSACPPAPRPIGNASRSP